MDALKSIAPKPKAGEPVYTWDISRTTDIVLSQIKYVLTTGIDSFDDIVGGLPIGRMVELYGLESCGKTAMAIRCAARAMKNNIKEVTLHDDNSATFKSLPPDKVKVVVVYIDNEQSLDDDMKLVVDGEPLDVIGMRLDTTDDMFKAIDGAISYQEKRMEMEQEDGIKRFLLIVVDTIASTTTEQELKQKWGEQDFPRQPQQISKALRQLTRRVNQSQTCILFTNQVRTKFNPGQQAAGGKASLAIKADDYTSPGGFALRFYASHRVFMYSFAQKYKLVPDAQFSAGLLVGFHTKKNRLRPPLRDGRMVLLFDAKQGGLHNVFSILETLVFLGFIEVAAESKHTGYTLLFKDNNITPTTFDAAKTESTLEEDEEVAPPKRGSSRKDPSFKLRSEWPRFYADHREDVDKLWHAAVVYSMSTEGLENSIVLEEETAVPAEVED